MVEVSRVEEAITRHGPRFLDRIFTGQEQSHCEGNGVRLAGRFAVKEAVAKALGTGIGDMRWTDIEVVLDTRGKPDLVLHGQAADLAHALGLSTWSVSMSHTATHAIGFAVAAGAADASPGADETPLAG